MSRRRRRTPAIPGVDGLNLWSGNPVFERDVSCGDNTHKVHFATARDGHCRALRDDGSGCGRLETWTMVTVSIHLVGPVDSTTLTHITSAHIWPHARDSM